MTAGASGFAAPAAPATAPAAAAVVASTVVAPTAAAPAAPAAAAVVALAPLANCTKKLHLCYQGSPAAVDLIRLGDPLACKPPSARLVSTCAAVGFGHYLSQDPIVKAVGLWTKKGPAGPSTETMTVCTGKCTGDCKVCRILLENVLVDALCP
jgi:hypothetical protein